MAAIPTDEGPKLEIGEVELRILGFIRHELLSPDTAVDSHDDLLTDLLDSVAVLRLATFVGEEFDFEIQPADFVIENFQNVAVLARYVQRAAGRSGHAPTGSGR